MKFHLSWLATALGVIAVTLSIVAVSLAAAALDGVCR
jgi:hypothetical protein